MTEINLNPVTIDRPKMERIVEIYGGDAAGAEAGLARQLTGEVAIDYPELITYEGLKTGTAPIFDQLPGFKDKKPQERTLSDAKIIGLFAVDPEGEPIREGTFLSGVLRGGIEGGGALGGAIAGAKLGAKLQAPIPPVTPLNVGAKLAIPVVTSVGGAIVGGVAGAEAADAIIGPEKPVTPRTRGIYEAGVTAGGGLAFLPMPFMISRNINLGGSKYLDNLVNLGEIPNVATTAPTTIAKLNRGAERLLSKTGEAARKRPAETLITETAAVGGAALGAKIAEETAPGQTGRRLVAEIGFSIPGAILGSRLSAAPRLGGGLLRLAGQMRRGEIDYKQQGEKALEAIGLRGIKKKRQEAAVERIIELLDAEGEDVNQVIRNLASDEFTEALIGADGQPIELTAGFKSNSPMLLAIETALSGTSPGLGKERAARNVTATNALRNVIAALVATGNPQALQEAALLAEDAFASGMAARLQAATTRQIDAVQRIRGENPESNRVLSQQIYEIATDQLRQARMKEKRLWKSVGSTNITKFFDSEGNEVAEPNFIRAWKNLVPDTPEARDPLLKKLDPLTKFVQRKTDELGLSDADIPGVVSPQRTAFDKAAERIQGTSFGETLTKTIEGMQDLPIDDQIKLMRQKATENRGKFSNERRRQAANAYDRYADLLISQQQKPAADTADLVPLTSQEVFDMRSAALSLQGELLAKGNREAANLAGQFAEGLLDDLNSVPEGNAGYDIARKYSKALNDVFTRAFVGTRFAKTGARENRRAPELLANDLFVGGADATVQRVLEINEIGRFAIENEFKDAKNVAKTVRGTTELIIRNIKELTADPLTGEMNLKKLATWKNQNKELLDSFPALKADLEDVEATKLLLDETRKQNKGAVDAMKGQITFQNLLPSNTESPTLVVSRALSAGQRAPMKALNNLLDTAKNAPKDLREEALSGLKHSILEWSMTKGGMTSRSFSPSAMYDALYSKIPNAISDISIMDWMKTNDVITDVQSNQIKKFLGEMVRLEKADAQGTIDELVETAGPVLDLFLRLTGSRIGTAASGLLPGQVGQSGLIAASAGSKFTRTFFDKIPESMKLDVMSELMEDPELLAAFMRRSGNAKEKERIMGRVGRLLYKLGFISETTPGAPARRAIPQVVRDDEMPEIEPTEEEQSALPPVPVAQVQPRQALPQIAAAPPAPSIQPAPNRTFSKPSGPVDRNRFVAAFPEDRDLVQGIGSLMS